MHKGLKSTLMTVAVALLGFKAMAMAPVINNIQDVIIGDEGAATFSNSFVYPDAYDVSAKTSDDTTSAGGMHWTYTNTGGHYSINNATEASSLTDAQKINPDAAHDLAQSDDPGSTDTNKLTITFRNKFYSPVGGPNTDPGAPGVQDGQVMTLIASDGTTISSKSFMAFIDNDGFDRLSGGVGTRVYTGDFTGSATNGWVAEDALFGASSVTNTATANGLCANAAAQGANISGWVSQAQYTGSNAVYNTISMANNAVYEVRLTVSTTAQAGFTPMWYFNFQNTLDWYGGTYIIFDNGLNPNAGANAPAPLGRSVFTEFVNAPAEGTATYTAALANPANATFKDFRLRLQTLDVGSTGNDPYGAAGDQGSICWSRVEVDKWDIGSMQIQSTPYSVTNVTQPVNAAPGVQNSDANAVLVNDFSPAGISTVTYTGGDVKMMPTSTTAWQATSNSDQTHSAFFQIVPGDGTDALTGGADMIDNFPLVWDADQLYRVVVTLQAPDAISESNPPDYFYVGSEVPTNELITNTYTTTKLGASGMPKQTAQDYFAFFHGNAGSTATGNFKRMRPHVFCGTVPAFVDVLNQGGIQFNGWRVERVKF
jgi:hypothetical protein